LILGRFLAKNLNSKKRNAFFKNVTKKGDIYLEKIKSVGYSLFFLLSVIGLAEIKQKNTYTS